MGRQWLVLFEAPIDNQNGKSSRRVVNNLCELNSMVDKLGFGKNLECLRDIDEWPTFLKTRDKIETALCKIVIELWTRIRFGDADIDELAQVLNENRTRQPIAKVDFVRHIVEAGGFPTCPQCKAALPPREVLRGRCDGCRRKDGTSLMSLHIAIECEHRYGARAAYTGGIVAHIPQWDRWRKRLLDYVCKSDETDHELLKVWKDYVRREHGIEEDRFHLVQIEDADTFLPPIAGIKKLFGSDMQSRVIKPADFPDSEKTRDIDEIEKETPAINRTSGKWIKASSDRMQDHYGRKHSALRTSRSKGQKTDDNQFGVDNRGHFWRVDPDNQNVVWYWTRKLTINRRKQSPKSRRRQR